LPLGKPPQALVNFDFEQKYFVEFGPEVKDHSIVRAGGVYHLFYLRGNPAVDIGHATSPDLIHWELCPPVLYVEPGTWDGYALWAPQLLWDPNSSTWVMYYTGVNAVGCQQTGMAASIDLYAWVKLPGPVYHPDPSWALWSEGTWSHGRDPFVFEYNGLFYQLLTAKTPANRSAIACGVSPNRYFWTDNGPLYVHSNWHVFESIQCLKRNSKWYLFYTEETVNGTSYMKSDSLFTGWNPATAVVVDFGHAAEINQFDSGTYIISRHSVHQYNDGTSQYVIRADTLRWSGDSPYVYRPWPLTGNWTNIAGNAFLFQPVFLNNPYSRGVNVNIGYEGMCWIGTYERYQGPLGVGTPGAYQGDSPTGVMRSKEFTISGNSMKLRVGGGNYPDQCYVALVDASTRAIIFKETGKNSDEMDDRVWDVRPYLGVRAYIEIADNSSAAFGHINCDGINESYEIVDTDTLGGGGGHKGKGDSQALTSGGQPRLSSSLLQNTPNPFNPTTTIPYSLAEDGRVAIDVFDVKGARVKTLKDDTESAGPHFAVWDGTDAQGRSLGSGIYFYRLQVDGRTVATKKMMLLK
jgi:hypothetical protein